MYISRPTSLGLALMNASIKAIKSAKVENPLTNPAVPWPARRVALTEGRIGTVSERDVSYPKRRD